MTALAVPVTIAAVAPSAQASTRVFHAASTKPVKPAIANGEQIPITSAPWQIWLRSYETGATTYSYCGGSIIDATHVLTAAHCVFGEDGAPTPAADLQVNAGISAFDPNQAEANPQPGDAPQQRAVSTFAVHPNYPNNPTAGTLESLLDDAAVLTLSSPLDLSDPTHVQAVGLPAAGSGPLEGTAASVSGFGKQVGGPGSPDANGLLYRLAETVADGTDAANAAGPLNALLTVGTSVTGSFCQGDSGGPLVVGGPTLVGIVSSNLGQCDPGEQNTYTTVAAGEIRTFIDNAVNGTNNPIPPAPIGGQDVSLSAPRTPLTVGDTLTCSAGTWTNGPGYTYQFTDAATGGGLQDGPSATYQLQPTDFGRTISCRATATTPGGVGRTPRTQATPAVVPAPVPPAKPKALRLSAKLVLGSKKGRRRHTVRLRVTVRNPTAGVAKSVRICVKLSPKLTVRSRGGGRISHRRLCFTTKRLRSHRSTTKRFSVRVKSNAKIGKASVTVTSTASKFKARTTRRTIAIAR